MTRARLHPAGYDIGPDGSITWQPADSYLPPIIIGRADTPAGRAAVIDAHARAPRTYPPHLVHYSAARARRGFDAWRRVPIDPTTGARLPRRASWHPTYVKAAFS